MARSAGYTDIVVHSEHNNTGGARGQPLSPLGRAPSQPGSWFTPRYRRRHSARGRRRQCWQDSFVCISRCVTGALLAAPRASEKQTVWCLPRAGVRAGTRKPRRADDPAWSRGRGAGQKTLQASHRWCCLASISRARDPDHPDHALTRKKIACGAPV